MAVVSNPNSNYDLKNKEAKSPASSSSSSSFSSLIWWWIGLIQASTFTMVYFFAPIYMLVCIVLVVMQYRYCWYISAPLIISALIPPIASPFVLRMLKPMLDYFQYEIIIETMEPRQAMIEGKKSYIIGFQPHGVLSLCGICSAIEAPDEFCGTIPTGVASVLLSTPILKHVLGIFNLISASKSSLVKNFKKGGISGSVVLYVGGMAELFLSNPQQETLYLKKRKGFIKMALQEGIDIVPVYLFGNTTVLSVIQTGYLANLSRKLQVSLTYFWGKWYLPIPRDTKCLYVSGKPLGITKKIENPTQEDIDTWHAKYCSEVTRIFDTYKEKVPEYKHKKLVIV